MELSIGIDVHKDSCTAYATYSGINKPRQRNLDLIERFNEEFKKFPSDGRGILNLHNSVKEHEVHILMENSTKTHDLYWMLKGLGHEVIVAHATDLKRITESHKKNDRNDAYELAHYMRRRLLGENEFNESYIPSLETLKWREMQNSIRMKVVTQDVPTELARPTQKEVYRDELIGRQYELKRGLNEPLIVIKRNYGYLIVDGHHRVMAAKELGMKTFRAVVLIPNDMNVQLGLEKTADRWGLHNLDDVKIIEGSKHPFIETTTMLLPDEEVEHIKNNLAASD